jgi:hypothetical protein
MQVFKAAPLWYAAVTARRSCAAALRECGVSRAAQTGLRVCKKKERMRKTLKHLKKSLLALGFVASASVAMAQFTPITNVTVIQEWTGTGTQTNLWLQSITAGGNTYFTNRLATGTTTGFLPAGNADDWNLSTLGTGNPTLPTTTTLFGGAVNWTDSNGSGLDFFLFEASGSANPDDISIAAILPGGSLGQSIVAPTIVDPAGWGNTGFLMTIQQTGQALTGLAWSITDLKDGSGVNLTTSSIIEGIAITAGNGIDPCGFFAVVPVPVPEPSTMALALLGLGGLALFRKRS